MSKKFFVAALALFALTSIGGLRANAQSSCPDPETFGVHPSIAVNKTLQSQIEVTYFTTDDPSAFISEKAGLKRSASYMSLSASQFVARLGALERDGLASIRKQQSVTSNFGETAELNLERNAANRDARMVNASFAGANDLSGLDRKSEINVYEGPSNARDYYRVSLLSWFVDVTQRGGQRVVDYDAVVLLKPGQTAVFKLASNYELKRGGSQRSYVAITMKAVNNTGWASLAHRR